MQTLVNLINGKSDLQRIVGIEPKDSSCEIFQELEDGTIKSSFVDNSYWLLSYKPLDNQFNKLNGNLFFNYDKQYETREEFISDKKKWWKETTFSIYDERESLMVTDGFTYYKAMKPEEVSLLSFDIETTGLDPNANDAQVILISCTYRNCKGLTNKLFSYDEYENEAEMLIAWSKWIVEVNPSVIIGHNIFSYDLNYLYERAETLGITLNFGRDSTALRKGSWEKKFRVDGSRDLPYYDFRVYGREFLDTIHLSIRADISRKYQSYGLKAIIKQEGWEKTGRTFYDAAKIRTNFKNKEEFKKIKEYCKDDAQDSLVLFDKFISPYFYMMQSVPKPPQLFSQSASGSQLNSIMIRAYLQEGFSLPKSDEVHDFPGAISEGYPGIYKNINKLDISSLYPSIMQEYRIYPKLKDPNQHFPKLVDYLREQRLQNKKLAKETENPYYSHLEQSQKILINSLYGFLGSQGLLFNYPEGAAQVTRLGRETLQKGMGWIKEKGFIIANVDTDSISFGYPDAKFITEEQRGIIREELNKLFPKNIVWEDDGYYSNFIVFKAKTYVMKKEDGKITYKGSALRSPILEPAFNEFIKRIIDAILNEKTNYTEIYNEYVKECFYLTDIERFSTRKTISSKTLNSERLNEEKIRNAIEGTEIVEGDRVRVYTDNNNNLKLIENYNNDHDVITLISKLYKTALRFETILDIDKYFINYALKKNHNALHQLLDLKLPEVPGWNDIIFKSIDSNLINNISNLKGSILPSSSGWFRAFHYFKPKNTKVIIIGQDPYPNKEDACGLAFSVEHNKIPASLNNIFKELKNDLNVERTNGNLEDWAKQGVLLLNSTLTVEEGKSNSHENIGWQSFTTKVIQEIINLDNPLVIIAWGNNAKNKLNYLRLADKVKIITGAHPSPLAGGKFFNGKYFSQCNEFLEKNDKQKIQW
jgi:DNA polymerase, archaea type